VNQSLLLHLVERLEGFVGRLPATIQRPILSELTPLKEIFLQERPPRLLFSGSPRTPLAEIVLLLFPSAAFDLASEISIENRWQDVPVTDRSNLSLLDARTIEVGASSELRTELKRQPADIIFFVNDGETTGPRHQGFTDNLTTCMEANDKGRADTKVIVLSLAGTGKNLERVEETGFPSTRLAQLREALESKGVSGDRVTGIFQPDSPANTKAMLSACARELPNEARIEMARLSRDKEAQADIAHILVKSTTAVCTAIGAQPIPLADLPILTTLQLIMVSGIMYVSGRERSLRAATEFVGALGANVGAGMLLREGTRAVLKFFPGWGNVVCGMVAGAGTYAIGRAATVFFLEGVSLKDARRTYLTSRKRTRQPKLLDGKRRRMKKGTRNK
jgi:uncharacterized protein